LPDLQSRVPVHAGTGSSGTTYQLGEKAGVESVTLTVQQTPIHSHPLIASADTALQTTPAGSVLAAPSVVDLYRVGTATSPMAPQVVGSAGGSQPHENLQPYLCVSFIISLFGIFPSQN
jgi:microcystin-dependent protein